MGVMHEYAHDWLAWCYFSSANSTMSLVFQLFSLHQPWINLTLCSLHGIWSWYCFWHMHLCRSCYVAISSATPLFIWFDCCMFGVFFAVPSLHVLMMHLISTNESGIILFYFFSLLSNITVLHSSMHTLLYSCNNLLKSSSHMQLFSR